MKWKWRYINSNYYYYYYYYYYNYYFPLCDKEGNITKKMWKSWKMITK